MNLSHFALAKTCANDSRLRRRDHVTAWPLSPFAVAPRQRPMRAWWKVWPDRIIARAAPRMTAAEARETHEPARPQSMAGNRLIGIIGTGRQITALPPDQGRETQLIGTDQHMAEATGQKRERRAKRWPAGRVCGRVLPPIAILKDFALLHHVFTQLRPPALKLGPSTKSDLSAARSSNVRSS